MGPLCPAIGVAFLPEQLLERVSRRTVFQIGHRCFVQVTRHIPGRLPRLFKHELGLKDEVVHGSQNVPIGAFGEDGLRVRRQQRCGCLRGVPLADQKGPQARAEQSNELLPRRDSPAREEQGV